jgi:NADPH-dependent curcumin reductase CurA
VLLSIDPANRAWMAGRTYRDQLAAGDVMAGYALSEVVASDDAALPPGSVVLGDSGWQEYAALAVRRLRRIEVRSTLTHHLSVLGPTGLTAYFGLRDVGGVQEGDTVLVSAAAGATGSVVGQIARVLGAARVVGITGSDEKNRVLEEQLGFDATVNHRGGDISADLRAACPDGVDVYFDNVGGAVLEAVLPRMKVHGRVVCCGAISQYDGGGMDAPATRGVPGLLLVKRLRMEGFIVLDYAKRFAEGEEQLAQWLRAGQIVALEDVVDGLEHAPAALVGMLAGDNVGKRMVRVGADPVAAA